MRTLSLAVAGLFACAGASLAEANNCLDAAALVRVGADDGQAMSGGVISDCVLLVLCRVFLLVGGHAHVLRCSQADRIIASETVFVLHDRSHQSATVDRDSREFSFSVAYGFRANMVQMLRARPRE